MIGLALAAGTAVTAVLGAGVAGFVVLGATDPGPMIALKMSGTGTCITDPGDQDDPTGQSIPNLDSEQAAVAATVIRTGRALGVSDHGLRVAIATAMQESSLKNINFGDRDSLGVFQQRAPWGPAADRTNVAKAAAMFFTGGQGGQRGLLDIPGWQLMPLWEAAQSVQVSAFPRAYERWETLAEQTVAALPGAPAADPEHAGEEPEGCAHETEHHQEPGQSTAAQPCTVGGEGEVWSAPGGVPIRVCAVGPFVVDTTIAPAVAALVEAARADGFTLGGSGARSHERQKQLYAQNCRNGRCSPPTARPGKSQHEWALALDLTCTTGGRTWGAFSFGSSPCYRWMKNTGGPLAGLKQLPSEAWHWSTTGR